MTKPPRASMFDDEAPPAAASDFTVKPRGASAGDAAAVRRVAEEAGFVARDPASPTPAPRPRRGRHMTGRTEQLNFRATAAYVERFDALADRLGLKNAEVFERAIGALEAELASREE